MQTFQTYIENYTPYNDGQSANLLGVTADCRNLIVSGIYPTT